MEDGKLPMLRPPFPLPFTIYHFPFRALFFSGLALLVAAACHRPADVPPEIRMVSPADPKAAAFIEVKGISRAQARALGSGPPAADGWHRVLRVSVKPDGAASNPTAVAGKY